MAKKSVSRKRALPASAKKKTPKAKTTKKTVVARKKKAVATTKAKPAPVPKKKPARAVPLQTQLDRLDKEILKLANQRSAISLKMLQQEIEQGGKLFNPQADDQLWAKLYEMNGGPLPNLAARGIFREILSAVRNKIKRQRVAYLGPQFSFTHLAAIERFGNSADLAPVSTIAAVFEEVNRGHADFGIVPIENSTDGRVVDTLDMFTRLPLRICGEVQIAIHHNLLASCQRGEITEIYSKPQALSQCREWLARNMPQARLIEVTSTSTAAQLARDKHGAAAVASRQAAIEYQLEIIAEKIEDNINNVTRFAVIGEVDSEPTGKDRTAILVQIPHKPGSLSDTLQSFKTHKINLTWIESFPLRGPEVGYLFFMDFEGHCLEPRIKRVIKELEAQAVRLEVLGSYPRSEELE